MKRRTSRPVILSFTAFQAPATDSPPRILPFPARDEASGPVQLDARPSEELGEVRERLFRMIVANQWDRSHGNRAS